MTALISPVARQLFLNPLDGTPASGFKIFVYGAGTTTKQNSYIDSTGAVANSNPIILDTLGECDIWLTSNLGYKYVFAPPTDTDPPTNAIWTRDNIFGSSLIAPTSPWAIASGTANAITATYSPPNTSLTDGLLLGVRFTAANTIANPTFTPDAQATHVITNYGGQPLAIGAIAGNTFEGLLRYNLANTRWELMNPALGPTEWAVAAGTSDAITAAYNPTNTSLTDGLLLSFRATASNATTTPTFAPDGLTAHTITKYGGAALFVGDIPGNLAECIIRYNLAHTRWELLNPAIPVPPFNGGASARITIAASVITLQENYNIASVGYTSTGIFTVTFGPLPVGKGICVGTSSNGTFSKGAPIPQSAIAPNATVTFEVRDYTDTLVDPATIRIIVV